MIFSLTFFNTCDTHLLLLSINRFCSLYEAETLATLLWLFKLIYLILLSQRIAVFKFLNISVCKTASGAKCNFQYANESACMSCYVLDAAPCIFRPIRIGAASRPPLIRHLDLCWMKIVFKVLQISSELYNYTGGGKMIFHFSIVLVHFIFCLLSFMVLFPSLIKY